MTERSPSGRAALASGSRGYTAVEVLISMTLFAIGAAAVVAMERTSVQGDADARQQDIATAIADEWVARLERDALSWKITTTGDTRSATTYLSDAYPKPLCGSIAGGYNPAFTSPAQGLPTSGSVDGRGFAYDFFGHDSVDTANATYCVAVSQCFQDAVGGKLIQATVLVYWLRNINPTPAGPWCVSSTTNMLGTTVDPLIYRNVNTTVLLQGGSGQP